MALSVKTFEEVCEAAWRVARQHLESTGVIYAPDASNRVRKLAERIQDAIEEELSE